MIIRDQTIIKFFYGLLYVIAITPLMYFGGLFAPFTGAKTVFFYLAVELTLPFFLYLLFTRADYKKFFKNFVVVCLGLFILASIISSVIGIDFTRSFWGDFTRLQGVFLWIHIYLFLLYIYLVALMDRKIFFVILKITIFLGVITSVLGLLQRLDIARAAPDDFYPRSPSIFGNPIFFASFLILPLFWCVYLWRQERNKRWWYFLAGLLIFCGILTTATDGAYVGIATGLAVGACVYILFTSNQKIKQVALGLMLLFGLVVVFKPGMITSFTDRVIMDPSAQSRLVQWKMALQGVNERPFLGIGPENYSYISNKYFDPNIYKYSNGYFDKPHNFLLEILLTRGVIGLLAYSSLLTAVYYLLYRAYRNQRLNLPDFVLWIAAFTAYNIQNLFVFETISATITLVLFLVFVILLDSEVTQEKKKIVNLAKIKLIGYSSAVAFLLLFIYYHIPSINASRYLSKAISISGTDPSQAKIYFDKTLNYPNLVDKETLGRAYADFVQSIIVLDSVNSDFKKEVIHSAITYNKQVTENKPEALRNWNDLNKLYVFLNAFDDNEIDPDFFPSLDAAKKLAPGRMEAVGFEIDYYNSNQQYKEAAVISKKALLSNINYRNMFWKNLYLYAYMGKDDAVLRFVDDTLIYGRNIEDTDAEVMNKITQLANFYASKNNVKQISRIYEEALKTDDKISEYYFSLAQAYAYLGEKEKAIETVRQGLVLDPSRKSDVDKFIDALK